MVCYLNILYAVFGILIVIIIIIRFISKYVYSYWDNHGIKTIQPIFPFGNLWKSILMQSSMCELSYQLYNSTNKKIIGAYVLFKPLLIIRDPELIQRIFVKDFTHFPNRGVYYDEENDPLSMHLFAIEGKKWKTLRTKLSPSFTSGKLKAMIPSMIKCCEILNKHLEKSAKNHEIIEIRELSASHSTNVIASVAFGIDIDCINEPNVDFRYYGRKSIAPNIKNGLRQFLNFTNPNLLKLLGIRFFDNDVEHFFISLVKQNIALREKSGIVRKDFFQLLMQLRNGIDIGSDDEWKSSMRDDGNYDLTIEQLAAQAFVFFVAGFETSSTTLSWCLYELTLNLDIQKCVHEEIDEVLKRHNGEFTYESLSEMKYLEMCLNGK